MDMNPPMQDSGYKCNTFSEEEAQVFSLVRIKNYIMQNINGGSSNPSQQALLQNDGANNEYSDMKVANMPQNFFKLFLPEPAAFELDLSGPMNPVSIHDPQSCEINVSISSTQASHRYNGNVGHHGDKDSIRHTTR
jgi:hypothetical protein